MAERNWRDEYEETTYEGRQVLDVWRHNGEVVGFYAIGNNGTKYNFDTTGDLIPKPKPKTYRPWKYEEVPVGAVGHN